MRPWHPLVASLAVLASTLVSGTLECSPGGGESRQVAQGRELYGRMCAVCHGPAGEGYKADQAPAIANREFLRSVTDPFLVAAITHGRSGSTMSAWGVEHSGPLAPLEVGAVVAFMRVWAVAGVDEAADTRVTLDERPIEGDAVRGQAIYSRECAKCHGVRGTGGPYVSIGNPQLLTTATHGFLRHAIKKGRPATQMPGFASSLDDHAIDDLLALLRSWERTPGPTPPRLAAPAKAPPLPLGPVPLNPHGPEPEGFGGLNGFTKADVIHAQLLRGARMGILDARAPSDYTAEHIDGAVSVPFYAPEPYLNDLPKDAWLVAYCGCPHAESGQLAAKLKAKGFTKVTVLDEGLRYWSQKFNGTGPSQPTKTITEKTMAKEKYGTHSGILP